MTVSCEPADVPPCVYPHIDAAREERLTEGLEDWGTAFFIFNGQDQRKRDAFGREGRFRPHYAFYLKPPFRRIADTAGEIRRVALGRPPLQAMIDETALGDGQLAGTRQERLRNLVVIARLAVAPIDRLALPKMGAEIYPHELGPEGLVDRRIVDESHSDEAPAGARGSIHQRRRPLEIKPKDRRFLLAGGEPAFEFFLSLLGTVAPASIAPTVHALIEGDFAVRALMTARAQRVVVRLASRLGSFAVRHVLATCPMTTLVGNNCLAAKLGGAGNVRRQHERCAERAGNNTVAQHDLTPVGTIYDS